VKSDKGIADYHSRDRDGECVPPPEIRARKEREARDRRNVRWVREKPHGDAETDKNKRKERGRLA
jgi:hypothetical protein